MSRIEGIIKEIAGVIDKHKLVAKNKLSSNEIYVFKIINNKLHAEIFVHENVNRINTSYIDKLVYIIKNLTDDLHYSFFIQNMLIMPEYILVKSITDTKQYIYFDWSLISIKNAINNFKQQIDDDSINIGRTKHNVYSTKLMNKSLINIIKLPKLRNSYNIVIFESVNNYFNIYSDRLEYRLSDRIKFDRFLDEAYKYVEIFDDFYSNYNLRFGGFACIEFGMYSNIFDTRCALRFNNYIFKANKIDKLCYFLNIFKLFSKCIIKRFRNQIIDGNIFGSIIRYVASSINDRLDDNMDINESYIDSLIDTAIIKVTF